MKSKLYILILIAIVFSSCNDDVLDRAPLDMINDAMVWDDPALVDAYILDIYSRMDFMYNDQGQQAQKLLWRQYLLNNMSDQSTNGRHWDKTVHTFQAGKLDEKGGWDSWYYADIRRCNDFFDKMEISTIEDEQKADLIGRVKLARAIFYFQMVKWYGGIPLITEAQSIETPIEELQVPRSTEQEVYDFIIDECDEIISARMLPSELGTVRKGDPSIYVAHALKSRAALYAASIARWGEVQINGLVGIPKSEEQRYWQACYNASKAIMDGPFSLYKKDANLAENYRKLFIDEDNSEVIFAKYYDGVNVVNDWTADNAVIGYAPGWRNENILPYLEFVESFENTDGTITPLDRNAITDSVWTYDELFGNKEPRFHGMIFTNGSKNWCGYNHVDYYRGIRKTDGKIQRSGSYQGVAAIGANINQRGRTFSGFGIKKGVDPNDVTEARAGKVQRIQYRLGEILLNYAEAAFYLNKKGDAMAAINQVRERVGLPAQTEIDEAKIRHERKIELAFETHRHWDLKRWRIATDAMSRKWTAVNYVLDYESGKYLIEFNNNYRTSLFLKKHYYFPLTPNRIANNPALAPENPGY